MVLSAHDLQFYYGPIHALRGISFEIPPGGIVALLGPNGAGKSTLSRIIAGLDKPTSGKLEVLGLPAFSLQARQWMGINSQDIDFPKHLRVRETLDLVRSHFENASPLQMLLDRFDLSEIADRTTSQLSGGQRRRLAVACTFAGNPRLVVLDEPTTGLDVESRRILWDNVRQFASQGGTVLLTTHYLDEVEALASRVIVIDHGQILYDGGVQELKSRIGFRRVRFQSSDFSGQLNQFLFQKIGNDHSIVCLDSDALVQDLVQNQIRFQNLEVTAVSLEEAFLSLVKENPS